MTCKLAAALILAGIFGFPIASAHAGPCTAEIEKFEKSIQEAGPGAGPSAPQSIGAQLSHQPTAESVKQAEQRARAGFAAILARAKKFDAEGKRAECTEALTDAKLIYFE
ncbi:hypothetical protein CU048_10475 [Beijerinckiaceae bacterium]|nr:hypothetical protein CU048_10475 [Beijerinckiaceae bacterium]